MKLKTKIVTALVALTLLTATGCAALKQWWTNFTQNPIAQIQAFEADVQTFLNILASAWNFIQPFIPAAQLQVATQQYNNAVLDVNNAMGVLQDGVTTAVDAQQTPMPNFDGMVAAVSDAIQKVIGVIDAYKGNAPVVLPEAGVLGAAAPQHYVPGLEEVRARNTKLRNTHIGVR